MADKIDIALMALKGYPDSLQSRFLSNNCFQREVDFKGRLSTCNIGRIYLCDLLDAAREVYRTKKNQTIINLDGKTVHIMLHGDQVVANFSGVPEEANNEIEFGVICPKKKVRLKVLKHLLDNFGVTGLNETFWRPLITERPLSNAEALSLFSELSSSVPNWLRSLKEQTKDFLINEFVPNDLSYYEKLCGPMPDKNVSIQDYLTERFIPLRQKQLGQNLKDALKYTLICNIDVSTSPIFALEGIDSEIILETAVELIKTSNDPFSTLGILEIILYYKTEDKSYDGLIEDLISQLCDEQFMWHEVDVYDYYPHLVQFTYYLIQEASGMEKAPVFWRHLCAFAHSNLLSQQLKDYRFGRKEIIEAFANYKPFGNVINSYLEMREYPKWPTYSRIDRNTIYHEVLGRLLILSNKYALDSFSCHDVISKAAEKADFQVFLPGPLEGSISSEKEVDFTTLKELNIDNNFQLHSYPWHALYMFSHFFIFPEDYTRKLCNKLQEIDFTSEDKEFSNGLIFSLTKYSIIHGNSDLIDIIWGKTIEDERSSVEFKFAILLILSNRIGLDSLNKWLKDRISELINFQPKSDLPDILFLIEKLKHQLPLEQWIFGDLEARCLASINVFDTL